MKRIMYELSESLINKINEKANKDRVYKSKVVEDILRKAFKMEVLK